MSTQRTLGKSLLGAAVMCLDIESKIFRSMVEAKRNIDTQNVPTGDHLLFILDEASTLWSIPHTKVTETVVLDEEVQKKVKPLIAQWNRAKATRNKNEMRDIERKIQCIRGY